MSSPWVLLFPDQTTHNSRIVFALEIFPTGEFLLRPPPPPSYEFFKVTYKKLEFQLFLRDDVHSRLDIFSGNLPEGGGSLPLLADFGRFRVARMGILGILGMGIFKIIIILVPHLPRVADFGVGGWV